MRRAALLIVFVLLTGCTLSLRDNQADNTPPVVTATLGFVAETITTPSAPAIIILSTASPQPSVTPTETLPSTLTPTLAPSETLSSDLTVEAMVEGTIGALAAQTAAALSAANVTPSATLAPTIPFANTVTPSETPTLTATATLPPTSTPFPTAIPPTRTRPGPPPVMPLDDGSGHIVLGTGDTSQGASPVAGVSELPETLYYLSDAGGVMQVWRLPIGFTYPEQVSYSPTGVSQFDVAPDGTLAYITPEGQMIVDGLPFLPPAGPDGARPQVTALAWSPSGDWLAYTLQTPGAADTFNGDHPVDGIWITNYQGAHVLLEPNTYGATQRTHGGPISWRPDGSSEVLVKTETETGAAYNRVNIINGALTPLWNTTTLPIGSYVEARWNVNGNAIIASGAGAVWRIEPDTLAVQPIPGTESGLNPTQAEQFANGTITFIGGTDTKRLYVIALGQGAPLAVTDTLAAQQVDFVWDGFGQQTLIVVYQDPTPGTPYLRDQANNLYDLTPLTGFMLSPRWGPAFLPGDLARVHTTEGDPLNVRSAPGGDVMIALVNGSRVMITGGPRLYDNYRWWRVQTPNGVDGWAVEAVTDDRGLRMRTLIPLEN